MIETQNNTKKTRKVKTKTQGENAPLVVAVSTEEALETCCFATEGQDVQEEAQKPLRWVRKSDGSIDWRAMIPDEFVVVNKDRVKENIDAMNPEQLKEFKDNLDDSKKLVLLAGFQYIMELAGYWSVSSCPKYYPENNTAICTVDICWKDERRTCGSSSADTYTSGGGDYSHYVVSLAENRALIRAVKLGLGIYTIYGKDELPQGASQPASNGKALENVSGKPYEALRNLCESKKITFQHVRTRAHDKYGMESENWNNWSNIPDDNAVFLMNKILESLG